MAKRDFQVTHRYQMIRGEALNRGEDNECAVRAVAIVADEPFEKVQELFEKRGRQKGDGTPSDITFGVLREDLGYNALWFDPQIIIDRFPGRHSQKKVLTSHSPDRFPQAWPSGRFLMFTRGHVLAIVDGINHDWSRRNSLRCNSLYKVTKRS